MDKDIMRGKGFKMKESKLRLDIGKTFTVQLMRQRWNKLPRVAVESPSLELCKARVGGGLSDLV